MVDKLRLADVEVRVKITTEAITKANHAVEGFVRQAKKAEGQVKVVEQQVRMTNRTFVKGVKPTTKLSAAYEGLSKSAQIIEGPLSGIASRISALQSVITTVNPALLGVGLALGTLVLAVTKSIQAFIQYQSEMLLLEGTLKAFGNQVGLTTTSLDALAVKLGRDTLASTSDARRALATLATSSFVTSKNIERLLFISQDLSTLGFGDLNSVTRRLTQSFTRHSKVVSFLEQSNITLTKSEMAQIKTLSDLGRKAELVEFVLQKLANVQGVAKKQGEGLAGVFDTLGENFTSFVQQLGAVDVEALGSKGLFFVALAESFGEMSEALKVAVQARKDGPLRPFLESIVEDRDKIDKQLKDGKVTAEKALLEYTSLIEKAQRSLNRADISSPAELAKAAVLVKRLKMGASVIQRQVDANEELLRVETALERIREKFLPERHKIELLNTEIENSVTLHKDLSRQYGENSSQVKDLEAAQAAMRGELNALLNTGVDLGGLQRELKAITDAYLPKDKSDVVERHLQRAGELISQLGSNAGITFEELKKLVQDSLKQEDIDKAAKAFERMESSFIKPSKIEAINTALAEMAILAKAGQIPEERVIKLKEALTLELIDLEVGGDLFDSQVDEYTKTLTDKLRGSLEPSIQQLGQDLSGHLANKIMGEDTSFRDIARSFTNQLFSSLIQELFINKTVESFNKHLLDKMSQGDMIGNIFKGAGGLLKGIGSFFGFGGGGGMHPLELANGGTASAGRLHLVGEQGPELFVPRSTGTVVPNHALGGSGTTINFTVNAQDAASFKNSRSKIISDLRSAVR